MEDDERIPDSNQDQCELESDNESNYELPDDKSTLKSNEKAKQNTHQTSAQRKRNKASKRRQRAHQKKILAKI